VGVERVLHAEVARVGQQHLVQTEWGRGFGEKKKKHRPEAHVLHVKILEYSSCVRFPNKSKEKVSRFMPCVYSKKKVYKYG